MNKKLKIFFISFFSLLFITVVVLFIFYNISMIYKHPGLNSNVTFNIENAIIEVRITDIKDNEIFIKPMHDYDKFVDGYEGENPRYLNTVEYISDKQE